MPKKKILKSDMGFQGKAGRTYGPLEWKGSYAWGRIVLCKIWTEIFLKFGKMLLNLSFWRLNKGKEGQLNLLRRKRKESGWTSTLCKGLLGKNTALSTKRSADKHSWITVAKWLFCEHHRSTSHKNVSRGYTELRQQKSTSTKLLSLYSALQRQPPPPPSSNEKWSQCGVMHGWLSNCPPRNPRNPSRGEHLEIRPLDWFRGNACGLGSLTYVV